MDLFELLYLFRFKINFNLDLKIVLDDSIDIVPLTYVITPSPLEREGATETEMGEFGVLNFSFKLVGPILSPESILYPKLLHTFMDFFVADSNGIVSPQDQYIDTINVENQVDKLGIFTEKSTVKIIHDAPAVYSRFNLGD